MKGKIDKGGDLHILRGSGWKTQNCPYHDVIVGGVIARMTPCGDWCPLFGEPQLLSENSWKLPTRMISPLFFNEFTDERQSHKEDNAIQWELDIAPIRHFMRQHEGDIADGKYHFGWLKELFSQVFGYEPRTGQPEMVVYDKGGKE